MRKEKNGVTLVALVITIVIILILTSISISVILNKRYFNKADYAKFLTTFENYKNELQDYIENEEVLNNGKYNEQKLFADASGVYYNNEIQVGKTIKNIINSFDNSYINDIMVIKGKLIYVGKNSEYRDKLNIAIDSEENGRLVEHIRDENEESEILNSTNDINIAVSDVTDDFTFELIFKNSDDAAETLIDSNAFFVKENTTNHKLSFGVGAQVKSTNKVLSTSNRTKLTYTYNSKSKVGKLYVDGIFVDEYTYNPSPANLTGITLSGDRNYYAFRIYKKCLDYSSVKLNMCYDYLNNMED